MLDATAALELKRTRRSGWPLGAIGVTIWISSTSGIQVAVARPARAPGRGPVDRPAALNEAETLGASRLTGAMVPRKFEFALALEPDPYDREVEAALPRRVIRTASTRVTSTPTRRILDGRDDRGLLRRGWHQIKVRTMSARPFRPRGPARSSTASACARGELPATLPHAWPTRSRATAPSRAAPIPTWTRSTAAGEGEPIGASASHAASDPAAALRARAIRTALGIHLPSGIGPRVASPG